ncbi:MAG: hypothetical protein AAF456_21775 [Planctomycetota bacterium]
MAGKSANCPRCGTRINFVKKPKKEVWVEIESDSLPPQRPPAQQRPQPQRAPVARPAAPQKPAPVRQSSSGGFGKFLIALVLLGAIAGGGYLVFPDVYQKAYESLVERFSEKEPESNKYFTSLDLEIEQQAAEKLEELWQSYAEQDDYGNPITENGRTVLTLEGLNQFNRSVDDWIDALIGEQIEQENTAERIKLLQQVVEKLSDDRSPLSLTSEITQLAARTRLQDRIQDVAIRSWEQHFDSQSDKIKKLSGIPETKLNSYRDLSSELEQRTVELIGQLTPDEDDTGAAEMFENLQQRLLDKYHYAANANVDAMLNVIKNEITDSNVAVQTSARLNALFDLYESSILGFRTYNAEAQAFEVREMTQRTPAETSMFNRRNSKINNEIVALFGQIQPATNVLTELTRLEGAYPASAQLTGYYRTRYTPKPPASSTAANGGTTAAQGNVTGAGTPANGTTTGATSTGQPANANRPPGTQLLPVEQRVQGVYLQLTRQFPELDENGRPQVDQGRVVLTQDGINELNRMFGAEIDKEIEQPVTRNQYVRKIFNLKSILDRMESETSPLSMISEFAQVSIRVRVQQQIQESAVAAWENDYQQQKMLIASLPDLPQTKLEQYSRLTQLIEAKALELLKTLAPDSEDSADVEMFNLAQTELEAKLERATALNFDAEFEIIKNELTGEDPNQLRITKIAKLMELYSQFMSIFKTYDYESHEFIVRPMNQLTVEQQQRASLKYRKVFNEIYMLVNAIEPASTAIDTLRHLSQAYPVAGAMAMQLMSGLTEKEFAQTIASVPLDELLRMRNDHAYDQAKEFQILAVIIDRLSKANAAQKAQMVQTVRGAYFNEVVMWRQLWSNQPHSWEGRTFTPQQVNAAKRMFGRIEADLRTVGVYF